MGLAFYKTKHAPAARASQRDWAGALCPRTPGHHPLGEPLRSCCQRPPQGWAFTREENSFPGLPCHLLSGG